MSYQIFKTTVIDSQGNSQECYEIKSVFKYNQSVQLSAFEGVNVSAPSLQELKQKLTQALNAIDQNEIIETV